MTAPPRSTPAGPPAPPAPLAPLAPPATEPARATFRELFAVRPFLVIFASRLVATTASTLRVVALSVVVLNVTGSAWLSAVTFGAGFLPQVVGGLLLGSLADRLRPRPLIATGYLLEFGAALGLALLPLPIWAALALVMLVAAGTPIFNGASSRLVADVLHGDAYVLGRSVVTMSSGAAQLLGLAAGGVAVAALGPYGALLAAAGCQLVAAALVRYGLPDFAAPAAAPGDATGEGRAGEGAGGSMVRRSWTANVDLLGDALIRRLLLIQWLPCAFVIGTEALVVAYSMVRGFPSAVAGLLLACSPAGMLLGQFVVGRLVAPATRTRLVAPLIIVLGAPSLPLALDPPVAVCAGLLVLGGTGFAYSLGLQRAFLDAVPQPNRGQAFGLLTTGLMTLQGVGPVGFGAVAEFAGVRWAVALSGATTMLCVLLVRPGAGGWRG